MQFFLCSYHHEPENTISIQLLEVNEYALMFSAIFIKGNNFCDFLFAFLKDVSLAKGSLLLLLLLMEKITAREQIFFKE